MESEKKIKLFIAIKYFWYKHVWEEAVFYLEQTYITYFNEIPIRFQTKYIQIITIGIKT